MFARKLILPAVSVGIALSSLLAPVANAEASANAPHQAAVVQHGNHSIRTFQGTDGLTRSITMKNHSNAQGIASLHTKLQAGDTLRVSSNGQELSIVNTHGAVMISMVSPKIETGSGDIQARFAAHGNEIYIVDPTTVGSNGDVVRCWRAGVAKWTYRGGMTLLCGGVGALNVFAGGACGLAASGAEDRINFNRAC